MIIQLWRASTSAANLRTEACDERSAMNVATVAPLPPAALMRADAMRVLVWLRPTMARFAPSAASASAAANPMPLVAPVIRICLLLRARLFKAMPSADDLSDGLGLALQPPANGASGLEFCCEHHGSPREIIAADVRRFGRLINKDGVLGTHRCPNSEPSVLI